MLRLELKPDQLTERVAATATEMLTVEYDEAQSALMVSKTLALLSPNEYKLVMALLEQRTRWFEGPGEVPCGLSLEHLCTLVKSTSPKSLRKQLQRAALKVAGLGIRIFPLHGEDRYFVLLAPELGKPARVQAREPLPIQFIP